MRLRNAIALILLLVVPASFAADDTAPKPEATDTATSTSTSTATSTSTSTGVSAPTPAAPALPISIPVTKGSFNPAKRGIVLPPNPKVMVIPVNDANTKEGYIDEWQAAFIERRLKTAKNEKYDLVLLEINTWGGLVDSCSRINSAIANCGVPVVAYVRTKAFSGGAILSLGCKAIVMEPGSQIGGALAVYMGHDLNKDMRIKENSTMAASVKVLCERNNYPIPVAQGMVDSGIDVLETNDPKQRFMTNLDYDIQGVKPIVLKKWKAKGEILTLTANEAVNTGIACGTANEIDEVMLGLGIPSAKVELYDISASEKAARALSHPLWRVLFVVIGLISLFLELKSPGHGAGYLGFALCMGIFFWLQIFASNAGMIELVLFGAGSALVALEIFVLPGVGVLGFAGFVLLMASIVLSFLPEGVSISNIWTGKGQSWEMELLNKGLMWSAITLISIVGVVIVGLLKGATLPGLSRMALTAQVGGTSKSGGPAVPGGATANAARLVLDSLIGQNGTVETVLRPAGKVRLNGVTYDAVSEGGFLKPGVPVVVVKTSANSLVVREQPV